MGVFRKWELIDCCCSSIACSSPCHVLNLCPHPVYIALHLIESSFVCHSGVLTEGSRVDGAFRTGCFHEVGARLVAVYVVKLFPDKTPLRVQDIWSKLYLRFH